MSEGLPNWTIWAFFGGTCTLAICLAIAIIFGCKRCRKKKGSDNDSLNGPPVNKSGVINDWVSSTLAHQNPAMVEEEDEVNTTPMPVDPTLMDDPTLISISRAGLTQSQLIQHDNILTVPKGVSKL